MQMKLFISTINTMSKIHNGYKRYDYQSLSSKLLKSHNRYNDQEFKQKANESLSFSLFILIALLLS